MAGGAIELVGQADFPACPCCGKAARRVWGNLIDDAGTTAYVVQWAPGTKGTHSAVIGLVFGPWGEGSSAAERSHLAIEARQNQGAVDLRIIDAGRSVIDATPLAAKALARAEVTGTPLQDRAFFYCEQIRVQDARAGGFLS
jgi:hypothetical protein